ncbi:ABC transporter substrate-binding protein [Desulfovibrio sp. JY]|nr:ABC transporter substrate-binding protein [Desulfovibrio sp. JY]
MPVPPLKNLGKGERERGEPFSKGFPSRIALLPLLLLLFLLLTIACSREKGPEVRLGFIATFSGDDFRTGRDTLEAARFAVDQANKNGFPTIDGKPCRVTLFVADDKATPEQAATAVRDLVGKDHVMAIIGPYASETANAAALAADAAGVPLIAPSATAAVVTAGRPHIFRIAFTDAFQGQVLGRLAHNSLGLASVSVIANRDNLSSMSLTDAFMRAFTACGGTARVFYYEDRTRDFGGIVKQALTDGPQGVFLPNSSKESMLTALALRRAGFTGTLFGGDAWNGPEVSSLAAFDGSFFVDHWREDCPRPASKTYAEAFRSARRHPPTELGALTQDAVDVVLAAVTQAHSVDPEAVTKALMALPPHKGVTGTFDFVDDGNPSKSLLITKVIGNGQTKTQDLPPPGPCPRQ